MMFTDRIEAGRRLAVALEGMVPADALILGIPRGGVIVAAEVARALGRTLDIEVVRKIGAPGNPEYAIAAVDADGEIIGGAGSEVDARYLQSAAESVSEEIRRRITAYRGDRPASAVAGLSVVLVDDGVATGLTLIAAVRSLRRRGAAQIIVAVPVASSSAEQMLHQAADEVVVLWVDPHLGSVGQFYTHFAQVSDSEVVATLESTWRSGG